MRDPKTPPALPAVRSPGASTPPAAPGPPSRIPRGADLFSAWLAPARGDLGKAWPASSAAIGCPGRGERSYASMSSTKLRLRSRLRDSATLSMRPARCGVMPTAVEQGPRVLLSQRLEWREKRARSTRPRDNHALEKLTRLAGESKYQNHRDPLSFHPCKAVSGSAERSWRWLACLVG